MCKYDKAVSGLKGDMQIFIPEMKYSFYSPIVLLSIGIGMLAACVLMRKSGVSKNAVIYTMLLTFVFILTVSFMVSIILTGDIRRVGFVGAGGALGLIVGAVISAFIMGEDKINSLVPWVLAAPLMYGLSKIACHISGCCYGIPYEGPGRVIYASKGMEGYFPIQLLEVITFVVIFVIGLVIYLKNENNRILSARIVIIMSAVFKIGLEYLRFSHIGKMVTGYQILILAIAVVAYITSVVIEKWN